MQPINNCSAQSSVEFQAIQGMVNSSLLVNVIDSREVAHATQHGMYQKLVRLFSADLVIVQAVLLIEEPNERLSSAKIT